jgi:hypothetical protein
MDGLAHDGAGPSERGHQNERRQEAEVAADARHRLAARLVYVDLPWRVLRVRQGDDAVGDLPAVQALASVPGTVSAIAFMNAAGSEPSSIS